MAKTYRLTGADGQIYVSTTPGELGGNGRAKIYGSLGCGSARAAIRRWPGSYEAHRVFFADEAAAIASGYRPCGNCQRAAYREWKAGPQAGKRFPWLQLPKLRATA